MGKLRGLFILNEEAYEMVYGPDERRAIARHVEFVGPPQTSRSIVERKDLQLQTEVIFSGWGAQSLTKNFSAPHPTSRLSFMARIHRLLHYLKRLEARRPGHLC